MRLVDADILFENVGKIKPRNKEHYNSIGEFMNMITNTPTVLEHGDELILKSDVIELIDRYYDKFTYESDADELIVEIEHMKGAGSE